jgi:uncharacterized protein YjbI with pentapeptide repeats
MLCTSYRGIALFPAKTFECFEKQEWTQDRSGLEWTGVNWSGLEWTGVDWSGLEWTGVDLSGLEWTGVDWSGLEWTGVDWTGVDWTGVDWSGEGRIICKSKNYISSGMDIL